MLEQGLLRLVYNVFDMPCGKTELFRKRLKANPVNQTALQDFAVTFGMNPLVYRGGDFAVGVFTHFALTRPVPWHILQVLYPLFPPVLRFRPLM